MRVPRLWVKIYNFLLWGGLIGVLLAGACASEWGLFAGMAVSLAGIAAAAVKCRCPGCGSSAILRYLQCSGNKGYHCPRCGQRIRYDNEP